MRVQGWLVIVAAVLLFAAFSSSSHYQLQSYGVGSGGTNSTSSTNHRLQASSGEATNNSTSSTNYQTKNGSISTEQANVPPAPTLSNGSSLYYNKLQLIIATGGNASDATYAVAASTNNFVSTLYVQSDGTLGTTPYFQDYNGWGGSGGTFITGLAPNTTYEAKVSAYHGKFTQSAYGPYATATTATPSITFSLSPTSQNLGSLPAGSVVIGASNINFTLTTNALYGANIYVSGQYGGLYSANVNYTIPAVSGDLSSLSVGFGLQGVSASSPLVIDSPYNGAGNVVGTESSTLVPMFTASSPVSSGTASTNIQAKASNIVPASADYKEVLTFVAAASF